MSTKRVVQQTEKITTDRQTGEVTSETRENVFTFPKEPPYVKLYLEDVEKIYGLPNSSSPVLYELLRKMDYDGLINLNSTVKNIICEKVGYKYQTLKNYLNTLVKTGVFRNIGRGVYQPNPHLFGRGDWREIYKQREAWLKVEYTAKGARKVSSSLGEKTEEKQQDLDLGENSE